MASFVLERFLQASPAHVRAALTEADKLADWCARPGADASLRWRGRLLSPAGPLAWRVGEEPTDREPGRIEIRLSEGPAAKLTLRGTDAGDSGLWESWLVELERYVSGSPGELLAARMPPIDAAEALLLSRRLRELPGGPESIASGTAPHAAVARTFPRLSIPPPTPTGLLAAVRGWLAPPAPPAPLQREPGAQGLLEYVLYRRLRERRLPQLEGRLAAKPIACADDVRDAVREARVAAPPDLREAEQQAIPRVLLGAQGGRVRFLVHEVSEGFEGITCIDTAVQAGRAVFAPPCRRVLLGTGVMF